MSWLARTSLLFLVASAACGEDVVEGPPESVLDVVQPPDVAGETVNDAAAAVADVGVDAVPVARWWPDVAPGGRGTCDPCSQSDMCGGLGPQAACAAVGQPAGSAGQFCLPGCTPPGQVGGVVLPACPAGSVCGATSSAEGLPVHVCLPASGTCGCSPGAQAGGWTTPCFKLAHDKGGSLIGPCPGTWACGAGGTGATCNAAVPKAESCNGIDDDCDGQTDEGTTCDDGDPCTQGEACTAGNCTIGKDVCDCHQDGDCQGKDLCAGKGFCNKATLPWTCGLVAGSAVVCDAGQDGPCAAAACDPASGKCVQTAKNDGGGCDADGNPCTAGDACAKGKCAAGPVIACDDGNPCTFDGCSAGQGCSHTAQVAPCDDGDACTTGDTCKGGKCASGKGKVCTGSTACVTFACASPGGTCVASASDGPVCDDGDACTVGDVCKGGACQKGVAKACDDGNPCTSDACAPDKGCESKAIAGPCDDGNACTSGDTCVDKACKGGASSCACQVDGDCAKLAAANLCLGPLFCNKTGTQPVCTPVGSGVQCSPAQPGACTLDACDPKSGTCKPKARPDGTGCSDGDACTVAEACLGGLCKGGTATNCNDGLPCTADACNAKSGCSNSVVSGSCSDGNACTSGDACSGSACVPGPAKDCGDGEACTVDTCAAQKGCVNDPTALAGKTCGDGQGACGPAQCQGGQCQLYAGNPCNDGNPCTNDGCTAGKGCSHTATMAACSDGNACTSGDGCQQGACKAGKAVNCDDGNGCTDDSCDKAKGCLHLANGGSCSDGNGCTLADLCGGGACLPGAVSPCDDGDTCTLDTCKDAKGVGVCSSSAIAMLGNSCPGNKPCNGANTCDGKGICVEPPGTCPSGPGKEIWPIVFPAKFGPAKTLYDPVGYHVVAVTVTPEVWTKYMALIAASKLTDAYFEADVVIDGAGWKKVGIRPFGYGSMFSNTNKPSIRISFGHFVEGQEGPGKLKNLRLKNGAQDRTFLRQPLSQALVQQAGGYSPRFSWARVTVNGEAFGLYQIFEHVDKRFFSANFDNNDGNEYERKNSCIGLNCPGGVCAALADKYKGTPGDGKELAALAELAKSGSDATWVQDASKLLSFDSILAQYAVEAITSDIDGLAAAGQNYTAYVSEKDGRLQFIPTGADLVMGASGGWYELWKPWGAPNGWCAGRLDAFYARMVATPAMKAKILSTVKGLHCAAFSTATMHGLIDGYQKLLAQDVYFDPKGKASKAEIDKAYLAMRDYVQKRNVYLQGLVGACP